METIIALIGIYGGFWLIATIFSWIGKLIARHKEKIRDQVLVDIQKEINIQPIITKYKEKLKDINYKKSDINSYYANKYLQERNVKLIGEMGNFLGECPACKKGRLVGRTGKYGNFIGCSQYPNCKYTKNIKIAKDQYKKAVSEQLMKDIQKAYS